MRFSPEKPFVYGESSFSLEEKMVAAGFPKFRTKQVLHWLYKQRVQSWEEMKNLPAGVRDWLAANFTLLPSKLVLNKKASDVTNKLLLQLEDKSLVETVLIRAPQVGVGVENSRKTVCVSSQVGCAYGCRFCASGLAGFRRDLSTGEIVSQLIHICQVEESGLQHADPHRVSFDNIVFMGMGEPLSNYDNVLGAIRVINAEWGLHFGARRITVSTSGLVPQIEQLAQEDISIRLAISLHGATNEVRDKIMPINRRYPLEKLIPAAKVFNEKHGRMLTLEFILIEGINDSLEQAGELAKIAKDIHAHVNCIPYNTVEGLEWVRPSIPQQDRFMKLLRDKGVSATIRREKGHDIDAACGQLRLKEEAKLDG